MTNFRKIANLIWSISDLLHGDFKQTEYGKVILPFRIFRRLDCVLEPTKAKFLEMVSAAEKIGMQNLDPVLNKEAGQSFHSRSNFDFNKLVCDPALINDSLMREVYHCLRANS